MVKRILLVALLVLVMFSFLGCRTVQGLGEDVKWIGEQTASLAKNTQDMIEGEQ